MEQVVLARFYHEIALKKGNRPWFLKRMAANLDLALVGVGVDKVQRGPMMAMIPLPDESRWPVVRERLERSEQTPSPSEAHAFQEDSS